MALGWGLALALIAPLICFGNGVELVRNINTTQIPQSSDPYTLGTLGGKTLFSATDAKGQALWVTDGTSSGTHIVKRLTGTGILQSPGKPFVSKDSRGYFIAFDAAGAPNIWVTDGTSAGTRSIRAFPSTAGAGANLVGFLGETLLFAANDTAGDGQFYATDGTTAGTRQLTAFVGPNAGVVGGSIIAGRKFYFVASDTQYNRQIWVSDGTSAGTHQLTGGPNGAPVDPSATYNPQGFQHVGGSILYTSSIELWRIDTATELISAVTSASGFEPPYVANPLALVGMGDFVLFLGASSEFFPELQLWRSDGTVAGTYAVADVVANPTFDDVQYPVFFKVGSRVVYLADDDQAEQQLWGSDGTVANTVRLTDATTPPNYPQVAGQLAVIDDVGYFSIADGASTSTESIWRTDGTVAGTRRLGGLPSFGLGNYALTSGTSNEVYFGIFDAMGNVSLYDYRPANDTATLAASGLRIYGNDAFFDHNGFLFFSTVDPVLGDEPWVSNGTAAGTHLLKDIYAELADDSSFPDEFVAFGQRLAFVADDGVHGRELWISDGTPGGTALLADIDPGAPSSNPNHLFAANGALYFFATDASGTSKFMKLPASGHAEALATLSPQPSGLQGCFSDGTVAVGKQIYFPANDGTTGLELWTSDGTPQGTHLTADIAPGITDSGPCYLTAFAGSVYFSATGPEGNELWRSNGTASGTVQVADIAPGVASSYPNTLVVFHSALYFAADDTIHGSELWRSDGTAAGTQLFADIMPGPTSSYPNPAGALHDKLLFQTFVHTTDGMGQVAQLWTTDGSLQGTKRVGDSVFPPADTPLINGNFAYFLGQDSVGLKPWVSDGTAAGTHILKNINPAGDANPAWFEKFRDLTLFEVTDPTQGEQLWESDGTKAGTRLVGPIPALDPNPSPVASAVHRLTVGRYFFIAAVDPVIGTELYGLRSAESAISGHPP